MSKECELLHRILERGKKYNFSFNDERLSKSGIYVFYQEGEIGHGGDRIVRIGQTSKPLFKRLFQHFNGNKDKSIFRKSIGRVILQHEKSRLAEWNTKGTKDENAEAAVSYYIKDNFYFKAIVVEDKKRRDELEKKMIATVAQCTQCKPSKSWFGNISPIAKIRKSGLWQVEDFNGSILNRSDLSEIESRLIKPIFAPFGNIICGFDEPYVNLDSEILILNSCLSVKLCEAEFYYGDERNHFWRILAECFGVPVPEGIEDKKTLLHANKIALWNMILSNDVNGIQPPEIADIAALVAKYHIRKIITNGTKTKELLLEHFPELKNMCAFLPSTSPANGRLDKSVWINTLRNH